VSEAPASFDVNLPYSNPAIANGTGTIVRIIISREELQAIGLSPGDAATGQNRYLADLALGDDGLPRSIHVPLPLRAVR
jgi:hypothetical protein